MPKKYRTYYEPFAGGAALFFHLEPKRAVLGDMNDNVINTYRSIVHCRIVVEVAHGALAAEHNKRHYYRTRAVWNRSFWSRIPDPPLDVHLGDRWPHRAAQFLYLNKTCFNGLWRENTQGKMNTPMGRYKKPSFVTAAELDDAQRVLEKATLRVGPFWQTVMDARRGDFVYMDPPYDPTSKTASFTAYGRDAFGRDEQEKLAEVVDELGDKGVNVMISNANTRFIRELYKGLDIRKVYRRGSINSDTSKRGRVAELLITNY
jgi:DNA adenine methylase